MLVFVELVMFVYQQGLWFVPSKQVKANMKLKFHIYGRTLQTYMITQIRI